MVCAARLPDARVLPGRLGLARRGCGSGPDDAPRPTGDGVRRVGRPPRDHRAVHVDPLPARIRGLRAVQDPRARTGLVARADDRRHDPPSSRRRWRPGTRGRSRLDARAARRCLHGRRRSVRTGIRRGPALEADHDRLHERPGDHDRGRSAAEAVRVLRRCKRPARRDKSIRGRCRRRQDGDRRARRRRLRTRRDPRSPAVSAEDPGHPRGSGRLDPRNEPVRPGEPRSRARRNAAARLSTADAARYQDLRHPAADRGRSRDRPRRPCRHDLDCIGLRRTYRPGRRRQPGDGRDRCREHRRRLLPGLPGQHQRLADGGCRAGRRKDPGHGDRGSADDRPHAPPSSGADEEPPSAGPRGRCDRGRPVTRRTFPGRDGSGSSGARTSRSRSRPFSASPCSACWPASRSRSHCR